MLIKKRERDCKIGSEDEPLKFYLEAFYSSKLFDLLCGCFSSSVINIPVLWFANFILKGKKIELLLIKYLRPEGKI